MQYAGPLWSNYWFNVLLLVKSMASSSSSKEQTYQTTQYSLHNIHLMWCSWGLGGTHVEASCWTIIADNCQGTAMVKDRVLFGHHQISMLVFIFAWLEYQNPSTKFDKVMQRRCLFFFPYYVEEHRTLSLLWTSPQLLNWVSWNALLELKMLKRETFWYGKTPEFFNFS